MSYLQQFRAWWSAIEHDNNQFLEVRANELIFVLQPNETAALNAPPGSSVTLVGLSGLIWVTVEGNLYDYRVRNGETLEIPGSGLLVFQSLTQNVPGRIQVSISKNPLQ